MIRGASFQLAHDYSEAASRTRLLLKTGGITELVQAGTVLLTDLENARSFV
jgi:hypothetical protein